MAGILSRFIIEKLHGSQTINVYIENNKIVLVGENGTGKSTVANFIYFLLTRQWSRLLEYDFKSITAVIDNKEISLTSKDLSDLGPIGIHNKSNFSQMERIDFFFKSRKIDIRTMNLSELNNISRKYGISPSALRNYYSAHSHGMWQEEFPFETSKHINEIEATLNKLIKYQVLYLPTYRRIEKDLRSIFRGLETQVEEIQERQKRMAEHEHVGYIEFVEFGMEDVEKAIKQKMKDIKDNGMDGLSKLTGTYLRDVILGAYKSTDFHSIIAELDTPTINAIFTRIPTEILPSREQSKLRKIIRDISRSSTIEEKDRIVAHYFTQLIGLHREQQRQESSVREFVRVCNEYLKPNKEMFYDNVAFEIFVHKIGKSSNEQRVSLRVLSSGEKQIVSLFAHIYLSGTLGFFLIIDEPELSLSVPWQRRLLPDILKSGLCKGLVAATHSPFIYDNELELNTRSIEEFMEPAIDIPRKVTRS